jgi:hypothetical protein
MKNGSSVSGEGVERLERAASEAMRAAPPALHVIRGGQKRQEGAK